MKKIYIFILAILLLLLPLLIRIINQQPLIAGEEGYYHIRMAELISEGHTNDPLLLNRHVPLTPYNLLLAFAKIILPYPFASLILSFVLGLLSLWMFSLLLKHYKVKSDFFILGIFVLSPLFVSVFSQPVPLSLLLFAFIATLFTSAKPGKTWTVLTVVLVVIQAISSPIAALFGILAPFCTSRFLPKFKKRAVLAAALGVLAFLFVTLPRWFAFEAIRTVPKKISLELFADFGSAFGLSIFAVLLAALGVIVIWKHKRRYYVVYSASILAIILAFLFPDAIIYACVIISLLAGIAYYTLAKKHWKLKEVKMLTMLVIFCGLLFSTLAVNIQTSLGQPSDDFELASEWLLKQNKRVVLSHQKNGYWLGFFSQQPVVLDSAVEQTPEAAVRLRDLSLLFSTTDIDFAQKILDKYNVHYIVVTDEMKQGLVWEKPEQGFLFLLENSETFKKRFNTDSVEVWEYRP